MSIPQDDEDDFQALLHKCASMQSNDAEKEKFIKMLIKRKPEFAEIFFNDSDEDEKEDNYNEVKRRRNTSQRGNYSGSVWGQMLLNDHNEMTTDPM